MKDMRCADGHCVTCADEGVPMRVVAVRDPGLYFIRYGDQQIDGSVASRLNTLRRRLRERTTAEVHDGHGIAVDGEL